MRGLTHRFKSPATIFRALKEDDDSSGDEKANKSGGKKVKNLRPPKLKSNWPPHLEKHHKELSERYPGRDFKTPIKTAINLLHALNLDEVACSALDDEGVIANMVSELETKNMHFGEELRGRGAFLISIFKRLAELDDKAPAQEFLRLCDENAKRQLAETEAYDDIAKLPPARPNLDRNQAKRVRELFIGHVKNTIKGDPKAYVTVLMPLIQGCPPSARDKVLELLADNKVFKACKKSLKLAAAVAELQTISPAARRQVDAPLALLVVAINLAMDEVPEPREMASDSSQNPKVIALFAEVEKSLGEQQFDLQTLVAVLCPGKDTTQSQAGFVAGLMRHLIQGAHHREELFDFQDFLSATLLSGMPAKYVQWLTNPAVGTCRTAFDVQRLVEAMEYMARMTGMEIPQLMSLQGLANIVSGDIRNTEYIEPAIKEELKRTGSLRQFRQRLKKVEDEARESVNRIAASFNKSDQIEEDTGRWYVEHAWPSQAKLDTARRNAEETRAQQRLQDALKSTSADVRDAIKDMALAFDWEQKLTCAKSLASKLERGMLDVQKVAGELAAIGTPAAIRLIGGVAATLPLDSARAFLVTAHEHQREALQTNEFAIDFVGIWYATRASMTTDEFKVVTITRDLINFLAELGQQQALPSTYLIQIQMKKWVAGPLAHLRLPFSPAQQQAQALIKKMH